MVYFCYCYVAILKLKSYKIRVIHISAIVFNYIINVIHILIYEE